MNKAIRGGVIAIGIVVAIAAYFSDNIRGYYRFKELCETEGGLKVFHPMQKNVGWVAKKHWGHLSAAHMQNVAFARYVDGDGSEYDIRYRSGPIGDDRSYDITPADKNRPAIYSLVSFSEDVPGASRTSRSGYEVREISSGQVMVRWSQIGYSTFDQDHTLLAAPSGQVCHSWHDFDTPESEAKYFLN